VSPTGTAGTPSAERREIAVHEDNLDLALRGFETYNRCGIRAAAERYWHSDIEWHMGPWAAVLGGQTHFQGRENVIAVIHELEAVMGKFTVDVLDAVQGPEGVLVALLIHAKAPGSGAAVEQRLWYAMETAEGRLRRIQVCGDPLEALEAVGAVK
jgi:ketosteroid isomerase-like protein